MNNEEYYYLLNKRFQKIKELREAAKTVAAGIIGNTLYKEDLFFTSALDRSVALLDGIVNMLKERNLSCVGILVRSQIDNCMRIFAAFIAKDKIAFMDGFIQGKKISDFKDDRGNKMKDVVLRERLEAYDSQISEVYKKSSGYCSHHKPLDYPIYDSYVDEVLRYYRKKDGFAAFRNDELKNYTHFKSILESFRKFYQLDRYNLKELDKYIWQLGKAYFNKYE